MVKLYKEKVHGQGVVIETASTIERTGMETKEGTAHSGIRIRQGETTVAVIIFGQLHAIIFYSTARIVNLMCLSRLPTDLERDRDVYRGIILCLSIYA